MNPAAAWLVLAALGEGLETSGSVVERQSRWLLDCLQRNAHTDYGRRYGFGAMGSTDDYRQRLPLVDYQDLAPSMAAMAEGKADLLFAGRPVAFERTGGSTGGGKLLPYSASSLQDFQRAILPWLARLVREQDLAGAGAGRSYWAISPALRASEVTLGGVPVGLSDGAYLGNEALPAFAALSVVNPRVAGLTSLEAWRLATLHGLLGARDLCLVSIWSPSFFLLLLDAIRELAEPLVFLLEKGGQLEGLDLPPNRAAIGACRAYLADGDTRHLWPRLRLVSCWGDGASGDGFRMLQALLPQASFESKGLLATEGVVSVPFPGGDPLLSVDSGFFEFLGEDGETCLAGELGEGDVREVVLTTAGGLYRYRTGDRIVCTARTEVGPRLRFLGRGRLVSDLVGEKLCEAFVADCLAQCTQLPGRFQLLLPRLAPRPGYVLVLEREGAPDLTERLEASLSRNPQYAYARRLEQLAHLEVRVVPEAWLCYLNRMLAQGQRLGDIKLQALRCETDWLETFTGVQ